MRGLHPSGEEEPGLQGQGRGSPPGALKRKNTMIGRDFNTSLKIIDRIINKNIKDLTGMLEGTSIYILQTLNNNT